MARFILIHGAWHGGWCWEQVVPMLASRGHEVVAPDLPGMGADAASGHVATVDEWAMFVAGMAMANEQPAILVGHSRGGIVISRAAEFAPKAVSHLVFLAAAMPLPGQTIGEIFAESRTTSALVLMDAIQPSDDGLTLMLANREAATAAFYGQTSPKLAQSAFDRLTPEPMSVQNAPIHLSAERYGSVARTYIRCTDDGSVPLALQDTMIDQQPCETRSLDADHSPFYSAPVELTHALDDIAGRIGA